MRGQWDTKLKFALGIFSAGIASFWYKPTFSKGWQFINNKLLIHTDLQTEAYFNESHFFLTKDQYYYVLSILEEVKNIRQPFISYCPRYQQYSQEFQDIRTTLREEEDNDQKFLPLKEHEFLKYVLPCYSLRTAEKDDSFKQRIADYWRLNDYLYKPTKVSLLTQFFIKEKTARLCGDTIYFSDESNEELDFHRRIQSYGFATHLTGYRSNDDALDN